MSAIIQETTPTPQIGQEVAITLPNTRGGNTTYTGTVRGHRGDAIRLGDLDMLHRLADGRPYFHETRHPKVTMVFNLADAAEWHVTDVLVHAD